MTAKELKKRENLIKRLHKKLTKQSKPAMDGYVLVQPEDNDVQEELERLGGFQSERIYNEQSI